MDEVTVQVNAEPLARFMAEQECSQRWIVKQASAESRRSAGGWPERQ